MKQFASISFILLLTWQLFFSAGFTIYWKINQTFIAKTLCENRDKPQMHCNGKCYLYKQLKKAEEAENAKNSLPTSIPKFKSIDNFVFQNYDWKPYFTLVTAIQNTNANYSSNLLIGHQNSLFRPPKFI